jgi:hypothetical protein
MQKWGDKMNLTEIVKKLEDLGAKNPCSRCGNKTFTVIDGYGNFSLQNEFSNKTLIIGGPAIPVVFIACANCGAITPHALGALQILPSQDKKEG